MKKFVLTCQQGDDDNIRLEFRNEGFNGMEIIAILETKKADLIDQAMHPEKFKFVREAVLDDGSTVKKVKEGEDDAQND
jgi:hypothetical protein